MVNIIQINGESDLRNKVFEAQIPVFVDFWSQTCSPCLALAPIYEILSRRYAGHAQFAKINVGSNQNIARGFNIRSIPTLLAFYHLFP